MQWHWPRIKDDAVDLALQELPDRMEKESLSLSDLQLAFGFVRVPDNVLSNLRQLLWVTQARPLLCHKLRLVSSEENPQKSFLNKTTQTFTISCCTSTVYPQSISWIKSNMLDSMLNKWNVAFRIFLNASRFLFSCSTTFSQ